MLRVLGHPKRLCDGLTRRELLQVGGAGFLGLSLNQLLEAKTVLSPRRFRRHTPRREVSGEPSTASCSFFMARRASSKRST